MGRMVASERLEVSASDAHCAAREGSLRSNDVSTKELKSFPVMDQRVWSASVISLLMLDATASDRLSDIANDDGQTRLRNTSE